MTTADTGQSHFETVTITGSGASDTLNYTPGDIIVPEPSASLPAMTPFLITCIRRRR